MRILLVSEDLPVANLGGAGRHAVLLGNTLIEAGHEVEMLGRRREPGVEGDNDFTGPLHCDIDMRGAGWQEHRFGAFLPYRREFVARRVWQAIERLGPGRFDVVHYHGHHYALGAVVPATLPFVQTVHDQGAECLTMTRFRGGQPCSAVEPAECAGCATPRPNPLQRALSAAAVRRHRAMSARAFAAHEVIFVSDFLRRRYEAHARPPQPLRAQVVHNFTDLKRVAQIAAAGAPGGSAASGLAAEPSARRVALLVGRIDEAKGFGAFLDAVPDALLRQWRLRVVGDGPQRAALQARHAARGVEFAGLMPQAAVYRETLAADACVVPSVWEEPCGTTILEALAFGKPVLALARGGTPELQQYERYAGQLVLCASAEELAMRLQRAATPPATPGPCARSPDVAQRLPALADVYGRSARRAA